MLSGLDGVEFHVYRPDVLIELVERAKLAVTALPSSIALNMISELVKRRVSVIDVSFFAEEPYVLEEHVARYKSVFAPDAGLTPGYSNLVVGHAVEELGAVETVEILVGEVPLEPVPPSTTRSRGTHRT